MSFHEIPWTKGAAGWTAIGLPHCREPAGESRVAAGPWAELRYIAMPMMLTTIALTFTRRQTATVPVAIARFAQEYEIKHGVMAAGAVLSVVPAILLLLFAQRHIVKGLVAGVGK